MLGLSKNTIKLLKLFYRHPNESFYIQQIGRLVGKKPGVFQRMLYKLEKDGILKSHFLANARFFQVNKNCPIYNELKSIISKTVVRSAILLIFVLGLHAGSGGWCQEKPEEPQTILSTLQDAISIALVNNKDIRIQAEALKVAQADILGARSEFLPKVDWHAGYTRRGDVLRASAEPPKKDIGVFSGYIDENSMDVAVSQVIYDGGANTAALREARVGLSEEAQTLRASILNVELEAKRLYYGLLLAYETKRIAEDLVTQAQAHYQDAQKKFEQGTVSRFDVLQSKVQVSLLQPELINAVNSIELIKAELNKLLGLNVQEEIQVRDRLNYQPIEINEEEFLKQAYLYKPEMILQSLGIDMSKWGIKFAKAGWLPTIEFSGDYNFKSENPSNMFNSRHSNWNAGVAVSLPIFDGFATKAKVEAARAKLAQSFISKENVSDQVAVDVKKACLDLRQYSQVIKSQQDNLEDAKEALKIANVRFDNGIGVNLDVLDSQVSLASVQQNLASGVYDYLMAQASLDRSMGEEYSKEVR